MSVVEKIENLVENECRKDSNIFGYEIWPYHIVPAVKCAKELAKRLNADQEIVEIAALLHDIASIRHGDPQNHHVRGMDDAQEILTALDYPQDKIEKVKHCILAHRGSKTVKRRTMEAECVASADAMAHFCNIPALLHLTFVKQGMNVEEGAKSTLDKLERSWSKLIPEAKQIVKEKYEAARLILSNQGRQP